MHIPNLSSRANLPLPIFSAEGVYLPEGRHPFSAFPALFLGTIIITHFAHGKSFSAAVMKVSVISANINVGIYAAAVRYLYPLLGLIPGTAAAFTISLLTGYLFYVFARKKMS